MSPTAPSNSAKPAASAHVTKRHTVEFIQYRVTIVASELLSQVYQFFELCSVWLVALNSISPFVIL